MKLVITQSQFNVLVLEEFLKQLNLRISRSINRIIKVTKSYFIDAIHKSKEYISLTEGGIDSLAGEFGFVKGSEKTYIDPVIDHFINSITFDFEPFSYSGNRINGSLEIYGILDDFSDVLDLGTYQSVSSNPNSTGGPVHWLEWLLLKGSEVVVPNYRIQRRDFEKASRSKVALMFKTKNEGGGYTVPNAGVFNDNWISNICDPINDKITALIIKNLED